MKREEEFTGLTLLFNVPIFGSRYDFEIERHCENELTPQLAPICTVSLLLSIVFEKK